MRRGLVLAFAGAVGFAAPVDGHAAPDEGQALATFAATTASVEEILRLTEAQYRLALAGEEDAALARQMFERARALCALGAWQEAIAALEPLVGSELAPTQKWYPEALALLGDAAEALGDAPGARYWLGEYLERAGAGDRARVKAFLTVAWRVGDYEALDTWFDKAAPEDWSDEALYALGKRLHARVESPAETRIARARQVFERIAGTSDQKLAGVPLRAQYWLGLLDLEGGDFETALQRFDRAAWAGLSRKTAPKEGREDWEVSAYAMLAAARTLYELGRFQEAVERYQLVRPESQVYADSLYEQAFALSRQVTSIGFSAYAQAAAVCERFLAMKPMSPRAATLAPEVRLLHAHLLVKMQREGDATETYATAAKGLAADLDAFAKAAPATPTLPSLAELPATSQPRAREGIPVESAARAGAALAETKGSFADAAAIGKALTARARGGDRALFGFHGDWLARLDRAKASLSREMVLLWDAEGRLAGADGVKAISDAARRLEARVAAAEASKGRDDEERRAQAAETAALKAELERVAAAMSGAIAAGKLEKNAQISARAAKLASLLGRVHALERRRGGHVEPPVEDGSEARSLLTPLRATPGARGAEASRLDAARGRIAALAARITRVEERIEAEMAAAAPRVREELETERAALASLVERQKAAAAEIPKLESEVATAAVTQAKTALETLAAEARFGQYDVAWEKKEVKSEALRQLARERERNLKLFESLGTELSEADQPLAPLPEPALAREAALSRFAGLGRDLDEEEAFQDLSLAVLSISEASRETGADAERLTTFQAELTKEMRLEDLSRRSGALEIEETKERGIAIGVFEEAIKAHRDDPTLAPELLARLAELRFEEANDAYQKALAAYDEKIGPEGKPPPDLGPEPKPDFSKSIKLYEELTTRFPDASRADAALYLLAYCLEKEGELDRSLATYRRLAKAYPASKLAPEVWLRIGEVAFDTGNLEDASNSYAEAVESAEGSFKDKALYKLGWAKYREDDYDAAAKAFADLLDLYESTGRGTRQIEKKATKAKKTAVADAEGELRQEAIQYLAASIADAGRGRKRSKFGGGDSVSRGERFFATWTKRPWEGAVWHQLGDRAFDGTLWEEAIAAYRKSLEKDPTAADAPMAQDRIIRTYTSGLRDAARAAVERQALAKMTGEGSAWRKAHEDDPKLLASVDGLVEKGLFEVAARHHQQAQVYEKESRLEDAKREWALAAEGYADLLVRSPKAELAYDVEFALAEALFASTRYADAIVRYGNIRDSGVDNKFRADAAYGAVVASERLIDDAIKAGVEKARPALTSKERPEERPVRKEALTTPWTRFVENADAFVSAVPESEHAPRIMYRAGEAYYVFDDFDTARERFGKVAEAYPDSEFAKYASNLTFESFLITKDWATVRKLTDALTTAGADGSIRVDPDSEGGKILRSLGDSSMFKEAELLMAQKKWDEAGELYEDLVVRNSGFAHADRALNNAAVARENGRRFDSALRLYERLYNEYPDSDLAPMALFRIAVNAEKSYDLEKALEGYQRLVDRYPDSKDRQAALANRARLLEGLARFEEAASERKRYARLFPDDPESPASLYRAGRVYMKAEDCGQAISAFNDFLSRFGSKSDQAERAVDAYDQIGRCYEQMGRVGAADAAYQNAIDAYTRAGLGAQNEVAGEAAGHARFQLAERQMAIWASLPLTGRGKALEAAFARKLTAAKDLSTAYGDVFRFKNVGWGLAASLRQGQIYERFATSLIEAPCPPDIQSAYGEEGCEVYRSALVDKVTGLEEKARGAFEAMRAECVKWRRLDDTYCDEARATLARLSGDGTMAHKGRTRDVEGLSYAPGLWTWPAPKAAEPVAAVPAPTPAGATVSVVPAPSKKPKEPPKPKPEATVEELAIEALRKGRAGESVEAAALFEKVIAKRAGGLPIVYDLAVALDRAEDARAAERWLQALDLAQAQYAANTPPRATEAAQEAPREGAAAPPPGGPGEMPAGGVTVTAPTKAAAKNAPPAPDPALREEGRQLAAAAAIGYARLMARQGRAGEALRELDRRVEARIEPGPESAGLRAARAELYQAGGGSDAAQEEITKALALDEKSVEAMLALAYLHLEAGRVELASMVAENAAQLDGGRAEVSALRGSIFLARGERAAALELFEEAVSRRPDFPEALTNLASLLVDAERPVEGEERAAQTIKLAPRLAEAHLARAAALLGKNAEQAGTELDQAVRLSPRLAPAAELNRGILALDASYGKPDAAAKLQQAIDHFENAGDDPDAARYTAEARMALERERRREARERRDALKPADAETEVQPADAETEVKPAEADTEVKPAEAETGAGGGDE